jgi:hypothetical protein
MSEEKYFTFPLAVIRTQNSSALDCLNLALNCGIMNAGLGYQKNNPEEFEETYDRIIDEQDIEGDDREEMQAAIVGAEICRVSNSNPSQVVRLHKRALIGAGGVYLRMKASFLWAAVRQARWEQDPVLHDRPEHGISWREFRVLAAILSAKESKKGIRVPSVEQIRVRTMGCISKKEFASITSFPDHLLPMLSVKQVGNTLNALEDLGFFARFRLSTGSKGGKLFYSFKHSRTELAKVVIDQANFRNRQKIIDHRAADLEKCREGLVREKPGQSQNKPETK